MTINIEKYVLPLELGEKLTMVCMEIQDDIIKTTGVPEVVAVELVAQLINRLAYNIHEMGRGPEDGESIS